MGYAIVRGSLKEHEVTPAEARLELSHLQIEADSGDSQSTIGQQISSKMSSLGTISHIFDIQNDSGGRSRDRKEVNSVGYFVVCDLKKFR